MKIIISTVIILLVLSPIYAKKVGVITGVDNPFLMEVKDQQIYLVERTNIYIYSLNDLKLKKMFGREGEGPGEFRVRSTTNMGSVIIDVYPEYILVNSLGKISFFTREGEYIKEIKARQTYGGFKPLGNKFIGYGSVTENNRDYRTVKIYDPELKESKEIFREDFFYSLSGQYFKPLHLVGPLFYVCNEKIFIEKDKDSVSLFENNGKFLYSLDINKGYKKVKLTPADEKKYLDYYKKEPAFKQYFEIIRMLIKFPEYFPGIRFFHVEDQKIYIIRWTGKEDKSEIDVFDLKGKLLKKALVPFFEKDAMMPYAYSINHGRLYQLVENEDNEEKWDFYVTEIE